MKIENNRVIFIVAAEIRRVSAASPSCVYMFCFPSPSHQPLSLQLSSYSHFLKDRTAVAGCCCCSAGCGLWYLKWWHGATIWIDHYCLVLVWLARQSKQVTSHNKTVSCYLQSTLWDLTGEVVWFTLFTVGWTGLGWRHVAEWVDFTSLFVLGRGILMGIIECSAKNVNCEAKVSNDLFTAAEAT